MAHLFKRGRTYYLKHYVGGKQKEISLRTDVLQVAKEKKRRFESAKACGQDNPLPTVVDAKFYEVTKQIVLTSHLVDLNYIAIGKGVWDEMTPEQQAKVQAAADAAAESGRQGQLQKEADLVSFLEERA